MRHADPDFRSSRERLFRVAIGARPASDAALPGGSTLTVNTTGQGSVVRDPDQAVYYCNEVVSLTATPTVGWLFDSWSGALTGNANPATVTMNLDRTVTANFRSFQKS